MRYARYLDSFNLIYTAESEYCKILHPKSSELSAMLSS
jgi:hypothetical protein